MHLRHLEGHLTVEGDDAAENGGLVTLVGPLPCLGDVLSGTGAARIHVLETHSERLLELAYDVQSGIGILDIVVGKFLSSELAGGGK